MIDREELQRLHRAATKWPWAVEEPMDQELWLVEAGKEAYEWRVLAGLPWPDEKGDVPRKQVQANAELLAYLRNAVPDILKLLTERDTLAAENAALTEKVERLKEAVTDGKQSLEVAVYGLPEMLERDALSDEEDMVPALQAAIERMSAALEGDEG